MNEQEYTHLREASWRGRLTEIEAAQLQKHLAAHPGLREEWETEAGLNQLLEKLPEAPAVASNFTALVLQAVERDAAARNRKPAKGRLDLANWLPKAAMAALLLGFTFVGYHQYEIRNRVALAKNVAELSAAVSASDPELMKDFDPIMRLSDPQPKADIELLALMK
jgi:hypothetical protein